MGAGKVEIGGVVLLAAAACSRVESGPFFAVPEEIEQYAVVSYDDAGRFSSGTPLRARASDQALDVRFTDDGHLARIVVIGYEAGALSAYQVTDAELRPGQPALPAPSYAAEASVDDETASMLEMPPALTAPWVDACAGGNDLAFRVHCAHGFAPISVTQTGCEVVAGSIIGFVHAQLTPANDILRASLDIGRKPESHLIECAPEVPYEGASWAFRCNSPTEGECLVDFSTPPIARFDVEGFDLDVPVEHYISGAVALDDRVIIAVSMTDANATSCLDTELGYFYLFDARSPGQRVRMGAPRCTEFLRPWGSGFVAVFEERSRRYVGWFTATDTATVTQADPLELTGVGRIQDAALSGDQLFLVEDSSELTRARIFAVDLAARRFELVAELPADGRIAAIAAAEGAVVAINDTLEAAHFFSGVPLEQNVQISLQDKGQSPALTHVFYHTPSSRFLAVAGGGNQASLIHFNETEVDHLYTFDENFFAPLSAAPMPQRPGYWLVAFYDRNAANDTLVGVLHPSGNYLLPGLQDLGEIGQPRFVIPATSKMLVLGYNEPHVSVLTLLPGAP